jgi:hypothetical protein
MNYFIDRLDTLHPRIKSTPLVTKLLSNLKTIYSIAGQSEGRPPSQSEVKEMRDLANEMEDAAMAPAEDDKALEEP